MIKTPSSYINFMQNSKTLEALANFFYHLLTEQYQNSGEINHEILVTYDLLKWVRMGQISVIKSLNNCTVPYGSMSNYWV